MLYDAEWECPAVSATVPTIVNWSVTRDRSTRPVKTWGPNLQFDLSRLHQMRVRTPHPLGNMPLAVLTATTFPAQAPGMTREQERQDQDHLRLQSDLTQLSTNSRQILVSSGHAIYLDQPGVVIRSIAAAVHSAKQRSRLPNVE